MTWLCLVPADIGRDVQGISRHWVRTRRVLVYIVFLSLLLASCSSVGDGGSRERDGGGRSDGSRPCRHDTGANSELVTHLPVDTFASDVNKRVVYSQKLELVEGQLLLAVAEVQMTNDLGYNVFVASQLLLAAGPDEVKGKEITAANGRNLTPDMHHDQQTRSGTYEVAGSDEGERYVNFVVWSAGSRASNGDLLTVDQGYGQLSVLAW